MSKAEPELQPLEDADPGLAAYAAALREVETPPPDRVLETLVAIENETRKPTRLWIPLVIAAAAVLVGVVFVGPSAVFEQGQAENPTQTPYRSDAPTTDGQAQPRPAPVEADAKEPAPEPELAPIPEPLPEPVPEPVLPEPQPTPTTKRPKASKPDPTPDPGPSSLAQETALLREIQAAQASGQHGRVLALTKDHAERFPRGTFAGERSLARVRALCRLGRAEDARKASDRFVRKHPKSHLVKQFESACPK